MKIILSRKGFDSSAGGVPNPILTDGRLISLPIPHPAAPNRFGDLQLQGRPLAPLVADLTRKRVKSHHGAHLDPDLDAGSLPRSRGWRPLFGQAKAAQGHLFNQGVGAGDLFLFFGWFRETEIVSGRYRFVPHAPDRHILFGWLQVEQCKKIEGPFHEFPRWCRYHCHFFGDWGGRNALYLARRRLELPGLEETFAGGGLFPQFHNRLVLTEPGKSRCEWLLPPWFHPSGRASCLSYHGDSSRWHRGKGGTKLSSAKRGQEFVLDCDHYPEAMGWAGELIQVGIGN